MWPAGSTGTGQLISLRPRKPDLVFYFCAPPDLLAKRITAYREIKFYEAGQDVTGQRDSRERYLHFAPQVMQEYANLHRECGFIMVDARRSICDQHQSIRQPYEAYLTKPKIPTHAIHPEL